MPRQAAALDKAVAGIDANNSEPDFDPVGSVLAEVPSTQPETPPSHQSHESRPRERASRPREDTRQVVLARIPNADGRTDEATGTASPDKGKTPLSPSHKRKSCQDKGRGILRKPAPTKVGQWPATKHRPSCYGEMLASQWAILVPQTPSVEFTAPTPPLEDSQLFSSQSETSQFQDVDEDYRPLTGLWSDIVEREEQASSTAATTVSAALATLPAPVAAINATASDVPASQVAVTSSVEPTPAAPLPIASLLLSQSTMVTESTVELPRASTGEPGIASASFAAAATAALDNRRFLQDADVTYAVRLAPAPDAEVTTDALLTSFCRRCP